MSGAELWAWLILSVPVGASCAVGLSWGRAPTRPPGPLVRRRVELRPAAGEARCAYCHERASVALHAPCPACGAVLHAGCRDEHGGCVSLGCRRAPRRSARPPHPAAPTPALTGQGAAA